MRRTGSLCRLLFCLLLLLLAAPVGAQADDEGWISLFDGQTLGVWQTAKNYKSGETVVESGAIQLKPGVVATGIRYTDEEHPFPTTNYELEYSAMRVQGCDFFAAATFPVGDSFCTFVNGGWGGTLVGLSSLNGLDASENSSSSSYDFKDKVWYTFRIKVTDESITVSIDDEEVVKADIRGQQLSVRLEMMSCRPLGFASWVCYGAIRSIRYRTL
ncbi:MAG: DUF1080 domain-containing protein [Planctomycetia bacterium]|nr:DUF1080 domain-containing protein [Planctomycetia bacterium]